MALAQMSSDSCKSAFCEHNISIHWRPTRNQCKEYNELHSVHPRTAARGKTDKNKSKSVITSYIDGTTSINTQMNRTKWR